MRAAEMPSQKIEKREKENPDNIDKVPVETGDFDRRVKLGGKSSARRVGKSQICCKLLRLSVFEFKLRGF